MSVGRWHLKDLPELLPCRPARLVRGQLCPSPGVCHCSLISLMSLRGQLPCPPPPAPGLPLEPDMEGWADGGHVGGGRVSPQAPLQFKVTCSGGCPFKGKTQPASSCCSSSPEPGRRCRGKDGPGGSGCAPHPIHTCQASTTLVADILLYKPGKSLSCSESACSCSFAKHTEGTRSMPKDAKGKPHLRPQDPSVYMPPISCFPPI